MKAPPIRKAQAPCPLPTSPSRGQALELDVLKVQNFIYFIKALRQFNRQKADVIPGPIEPEN
ncbi:hypothetical protein PBF_22667 [Cytobacillus firmus DS1]|uniref:Uncharacterized protein n=1 Tax=Cytobacillus firmus DS1 TaxID=1307436 RepID=W7LAA7_CYTFI|nr:hypothetical protein PBF_22667 [Cytobacillus firmus DS1]